MVGTDREEVSLHLFQPKTILGVGTTVSPHNVRTFSIPRIAGALALSVTFAMSEPTILHSSPAGIPQTEANPLLDEWDTPAGVPPFDRIRAEHYEPAFDAGIAESRAQLERIATQEARPDFQNTIEALEAASPLLGRTQGAFFTTVNADATPAMQEVRANVMPKLTRQRSDLYLDQRLFSRVETLWRDRENLDLTAEQGRLLEVTHRSFLRAGAALSESQRERVAELDQALSKRQVDFTRNLLADQKSSDIFLTESQVAGLPAAMRASAAAKAEAAGRANEFLISSTRSDVEPFLTLASDRKAREAVFRAFNGRGDSGNAHDNNQLIIELLTLRAERSRLLGFKSFAAYQVAESMAGSPQAAMALLKEVYAPAVVKAREEDADLLKLANADGIDRIEPWDWRYYAEKVRAERYDLDDATLKEYLPLDGMVAAMIETTTRLFGLSFHERPDIPTYADGVRVWEIREADGRHIGIFYADWFARDTKQPGAWMNSIRVHSSLLGHTPLIVNNCNYTPPAEGGRATISEDDLRVMFHEFGHALHGLLSKARYPSLSGPSRTIFTDFVELPSLIFEHWAMEPAILRRHARNADGEPIPEDLLQALLKASTFNQGFQTVQQLSSAILDMELHLLPGLPADLSPGQWESQQLEALGVPGAIGMRHRLAHFSHLFGGGYAAKYYSYTWSEAMSADGFEAFKETGDAFDPATALRFRSEVLETGDTRDPKESYTAFRGRMPTADALLRNRGLLK